MSYRVTVVVEETNEHGEVINQPGSWPLNIIQFGNLADAITHGQTVRAKANKIIPKVYAKGGLTS